MILLLPGTTDRVAIAWVVSRKTLVKPVSGRKSAARLLCSLDRFKTIGEGRSKCRGCELQIRHEKQSKTEPLYRQQIRAAQENAISCLRRINLLPVQKR